MYYSLLLKFDLGVAILIIIFEAGHVACLFIFKTKENKNEQKNKERND